MSCPASSTGGHNFQLRTIVTDEGVIVVRVCILCNAEG